MRLTIAGWRKGRRGQALVEFTLVFPILVLVLFSIIVFGLYVFYSQQLQNAARDASRYAAVHTSTAVCPTVSRLDPPDPLKPPTYWRCDRPEDGWPNGLRAAARSSIWGMDPAQVSVTACWSGYVDGNNNYDALPAPPNVFTDCTMRDPGLLLAPVNPRTEPAALPCPATTIGPSSTVNPKADGDDKASDIAAMGNTAPYPTTVTVYACFQWIPPMAGFVFIPSQVTLRAVITEALQRQQ